MCDAGGASVSCWNTSSWLYWLWCAPVMLTARTCKLTWDSGDTATLTIERLEPPRVFGYTWPVYGLPADDPRRTYVEFTLEPTSSGTTLTMVESGFAQLPEDGHKVAFSGNTRGWTNELGEFVAYLDGQA